MENVSKDIYNTHMGFIEVIYLMLTRQGLAGSIVGEMEAWQARQEKKKQWIK
jgi:hypothetical protein